MTGARPSFAGQPRHSPSTGVRSEGVSLREARLPKAARGHARGTDDFSQVQPVIGLLDSNTGFVVDAVECRAALRTGSGDNEFLSVIFDSDGIEVPSRVRPQMVTRSWFRLLGTIVAVVRVCRVRHERHLPRSGSRPDFRATPPVSRHGMVVRRRPSPAARPSAVISPGPGQPCPGNGVRHSGGVRSPTRETPVFEWWSGGMGSFLRNHVVFPVVRSAVCHQAIDAKLSSG